MGCFKITAVILLITSGIIGAIEDEFIELNITQGLIQGTTLKSRENRTFYGFMGIPYAQAPPRFFEALLPPPSWREEGITYNATNYGEKCLQLNFTTGETQGSENCFFVNVFTPYIPGNLSVLVFIHGGGFQFGLASENGPEFFMDEDVVFVTVQYRLGAFGFLSTGDEVLPGNLGLKDQNLALKWVQENIHFFGGDPSKVTLFGESAGSASVHLHILSPLSQGLFRYAVGQSGTALERWAVAEGGGNEIVKRLAEKLNCSSDNNLEIITCLRGKSAEEIVKAQMKSSPLDSVLIYGPVIEPEGSSAFVVGNPKELYEQERFNKVPTLITFNDLEGLTVNALGALGDPEILQALNNDWDNSAPKLFSFDKPSYSREAVQWASEKLKEFYFAGREVGWETLINLTNIYTDSGFSHKTKKAALIQAKHSSDPVFVAMLGFKGIWSQSFLAGFEEVLGMAHADDLSYLFTDYRYPEFPKGSESEAFSKLLVRLWVNFANTGDPDYSVNGERWLPVQQSEIESERINWLFFKNGQPEFIVEPLEERMKLWDEIEDVLESGRIPPNKNENNDNLLVL